MTAADLRKDFDFRVQELRQEQLEGAKEVQSMSFSEAKLVNKRFSGFWCVFVRHFVHTPPQNVSCRPTPMGFDDHVGGARFWTSIVINGPSEIQRDLPTRSHNHGPVCMRHHGCRVRA